MEERMVVPPKEYSFGVPVLVERTVGMEDVIIQIL
jgi:hypothetical protein